MMMMSYQGRLLLLGLVANLAVTLALLVRLAGPARLRGPGFGPVMESGHVALAAGMAYMFAPTGWQRLPARALAAGYLGLSLFYLAYTMVGPCTVSRSRWHCRVLAVIESLAMAYMFTYGSWGSTDLTAGLRLVFAAVAVVATGRLLLGGRLAMPEGVSPTTLGARTVMASGMLAMLLLAHTM
jgi:hypothetical protein